MKLFSAVLAITFLSFAVVAQDWQKDISALVSARNYQAAVIELKKLESSDKKVFELNNYAYLLARMAEKAGDFPTAGAYYQATVKKHSVLSEYALWHLSQIARSSGNLVLERNYLRELIATAPVSLLKSAALSRLAFSQFESKDYKGAIATLSGVTAPTNPSTPTPPAQTQQMANDPQTRETTALLGECYFRSGQTNEARDTFTRLANNLPNPAQPDDFALAAVIALDTLDGGAENLNKTAPQLSDSEHLRRATIYQFNRSFASARLHFIAIVERHPQSQFVPDALYQIGRGYVQEGTFDEATKWFERFQTEFPDNPIARDALSQAASAYTRMNKPKEATARYQKFIETYPDADNVDRAYLNLIDIHRDTGDNAGALKWAATTREKFKGKLPEAIAQFAEARIRISQNNWAEALAVLDALQTQPDLGGTRVPAGTNKNEVAFLRGFTLEQLGRYQEAISTYMSIPDGRNEYYGGRATERLNALAINEASAQMVLQKLNELRAVAGQPVNAQSAENIRQAAQSALRLATDPTTHVQMLDILKVCYPLIPAFQKVPKAKLLEFGRKEILKEKHPVSQDYHQAIADDLLFLGLYDEGTPELETSLREKRQLSAAEQVKSVVIGQTAPNSLSDFPPDTAFTLAIYYKRGDMASRAIGYLEALWRGLPLDYQIELIPRDQLEILYPTPYADSLLKYGTERNLDPRFTLSIMRQESRFRADVKSVAAARGLMQFISTTSNQIAAELGKKNFQQNELYHPPTAILFGSQYLANLFKIFPNLPPAVAASYNGGEGNMTRWIARAKMNDPDRYVSEIIFSQSKDYVYKVMANYRVYQIFYDERLNAK